MDFPGVCQGVFRASGPAVPHGQKDIAVLHDLLIPRLKRLQDRFSPIFCPVGQELKIPDPGGLRSLKSESIDSPGAAGNDSGYFSASQTVLPAKGTERLVPHRKVRDEIEIRDGPASGDSQFHKKRGAPVTPL